MCTRSMIPAVHIANIMQEMTLQGICEEAIKTKRAFTSVTGAKLSAVMERTIGTIDSKLMQTRLSYSQRRIIKNP